jgi:flagellin
MSSFGDINRVNTNIQALDSQLSLNRINRNLADNQLRLSTGLKINRAEDDAAGYSIATKLNARVAGLSQALANTGDAKSVLDITESSFNTVMDQLIEMKGLATRAANDTLGSTERSFIGDQIAALGKDINEIANQTVFQDFELLNGSGGNFSGDLSLTFQVGERAADTVSVDISAVNANSLFTASEATVNGTSTGLAIAGGATGATVANVAITVAGNTTSVAVSGATSAGATSAAGLEFRQNIVDSINSSGVAGIKAELNSTTGAVTVSNFNSEEEATVGLTTSANAAVGTAQTLAVGTLKDASGQGSMVVDDWSASDFRSFIKDVDSAITAMAERVNTVGIAQSSLSLREVTLSQSISANSAAASRIMDTDFAKEQSESIRLQILQQTATSAFAQANSGPQSVLGFLR